MVSSGIFPILQMRTLMNNVELCLQQRSVTEIPSFPAPRGDQPVYLREVAISHFCHPCPSACLVYWLVAKLVTWPLPHWGSLTSSQRSVFHFPRLLSFLLSQSECALWFQFNSSLSSLNPSSASGGKPHPGTPFFPNERPVQNFWIGLNYHLNQNLL